MFAADNNTVGSLDGSFAGQHAGNPQSHCIAIVDIAYRFNNIKSVSPQASAGFRSPALRGGAWGLPALRSFCKGGSGPSSVQLYFYI
jgi:hypothetical protein